MTSSHDRKHMTRALDLAQRAWGATHPNPMVGCVIAQGSRVLAKGWHARAGEAHAEAAALQELKSKGAPIDSETAMYVTLEPCSTRGRTPPCVEAILNSGLRRVFIGAIDPNPDHAGRGIQLLRDGGVDVRQGLLAEQCADINLVFNHWIVERKPLIAGKIATTIDGRIATREGRSKWITGAAARADVMRWRKLFPAIAVGAGTALADNPRLTARIEKEPETSPIRFVFDATLSTGSIAESLSLYTDKHRAMTVALAAQGRFQSERKASILDLGAQVWELPADGDGNVCADAFSARCAEEGICGVLVEGGAGLLSSLLASNSLHYLFAYRAPKLLADERAICCFKGQSPMSIENGYTLSDVRSETLGVDQLMRGSIEGPNH